MDDPQPPRGFTLIVPLVAIAIIATLDASKDLTGCNLIHRYPLLTGQPKDMCEQSTAGCANTSAANICNHFTYP